MDYVKVNIMTLNKQVKGILLHSGMFLLSDILVHKESNYQTLQTEPQLNLA